MSILICGILGQNVAVKIYVGKMKKTGVHNILSTIKKTHKYKQKS